LRFLPEGGPQPALDAGADAVVQSCHKTLGSMVGTALLHVGRESRVDPVRLRETLNLLQTTSPNYLMLASLDAVRRHMWRSGREQFGQAVQDAQSLASELSSLPGIDVLQTKGNPALAGHRRDPLRVVVNVVQTGWTGYEVERHLRTNYQVEDEFADSFNVVLVLSPGDDAAARGRLIEAFRSVSRNPRAVARSTSLAASHMLQPPIPSLLLSPREAVLGQVEMVQLERAVGRAAAETVTFYPPGIPLLMPGEAITEETLAVCQDLHSAGATCYATDTTLATFKVAVARTTHKQEA
jgi:lysine decarboxylase